MVSILERSVTKDARDIIIRYPVLSDVNQLCFCINAISKERTYTAFQGEEVAFYQEELYLEGMLQEIKNRTAIMILAICDEKVVGIADIKMKRGIWKHVGSFGIMILKDYRNLGIGTIMMETILDEAKDQLLNIKLITFPLFADNVIAHKLYLKMGFKEYGYLPGGIFYNEDLKDELLMYKEI